MSCQLGLDLMDYILDLMDIGYILCLEKSKCLR